MEIKIDAATAGKTIFTLTRRDMGLSSAILKRLKYREGGILVNGNFVTVRYLLREGDILTLATEDAPEDVSPYIFPVPLELPVLFEDDWITAVNKPPDMPSHPSLGHKDDTVANALAYRYAGKTYVFRPVNRLDRDTSGVMLTANSKTAAYKMFLAMQAGDIHKQYLAVTDGVPPQKSGVITGYMHRAADSIIVRETCAETDEGAAYAETRYRVLHENGGHAVLLVSPVTGRTHQIRVQMASIGCPLTGDSLYGTESADIARHALHAVRTTFPHPRDGQAVTVFAPVPADMLALFENLGYTFSAADLET